MAFRQKHQASGADCTIIRKNGSLKINIPYERSPTVDEEHDTPGFSPPFQRCVDGAAVITTVFHRKTLGSFFAPLIEALGRDVND